MVFHGFNEVIFAEPHIVRSLDGREMILAILLDRHRGHQQAVRPRFQRELGPVIQNHHAAGQRFVGLDRYIGFGPLHRAQVAARIFHRVLDPQPGREVIRHPDLLHARQIHHGQFEGIALHAAGFHVVFRRLRHARDQELVRRTPCLRPHLRLLPFGSARVLQEEPHFRSGETDQVRADGLVGTFAHRLVAGRHADRIERLGRALRQAGPEQRRAVTEEARAGRSQPEQNQRGDHGGR